MSRFGLGFTGGLSGNDAFTKILLHMDGSNGGTAFTDSNIGGSAHSWIAHSATTDTGTVKFGTASLNCGAAAGYIDTPDSSDFTLGSGDWTVDFWFNVQGGAGTQRRSYGQSDSTGAVVAVNGGLLTSNACFLQAGGSPNITVSGTTAITTAGWHHYAGVRAGNVLKLFVDGIQEGGDVAFTGAVTNSADNFSVGRATLSQIWNGFIDEFRLSVGIARWTANFTPPANQYG